MKSSQQPAKYKLLSPICLKMRIPNLYKDSKQQQRWDIRPCSKTTTATN